MIRIDFFKLPNGYCYIWVAFEQSRSGRMFRKFFFLNTNAILDDFLTGEWENVAHESCSQRLLKGNIKWMTSIIYTKFCFFFKLFFNRICLFICHFCNYVFWDKNFHLPIGKILEIVGFSITCITCIACSCEILFTIASSRKKRKIKKSN